MRSIRRLTPAVIALCATLAACSVSSSDGSGAADTTATSVPDTTVPSESTASTEPQPLSRGVTADAIKIGGAVIDVDAVKAQFGVDLGVLPPEAVQGIVDWINEDGINGRKIDYVERRFIPVGTESSEQACRELIEDEQVFAVLGTFLDANPMCVTEKYATPYFGGFGLTDEFQQRSKAPFITTGSNFSDELKESSQLLVDKGSLTGKKVAVYYESGFTADFVQQNVIDLLTAGGVDVVSSAQLPDTAGDQVAAAAAIDRIFQKFQADGADTVVAASGLPTLLPGLEKTTWKPFVVIMNGQIQGPRAAESFGLTNPATLDGAIGVTSGGTSDELKADPILNECIAGINRHTSLAITIDDLLPKKEVPTSRDFTTIPALCGGFDLMRKVLIAAGDNPSSESIIAGLDTLKIIAIVGNPEASLSSTRWGAGGPIRIWKYDTASVTFSPENG